MLVMKSGVVLRSTSGPMDTILDAELQGRVILCNGGDAATTIEGFTIRGGDPNGNGCIPACFYGSGGGVLW